MPFTTVPLRVLVGVICAIVTLATSACAGRATPVARAAPRAGMTIARSTTFAPAVYRLPAPTGGDDAADARAVIQVRGDDVTIDFAGATLDGAPADDAMPDQFRGTAIRIDGGKHVTVKNLVVRGYKIALHARGVEGLQLINCDFSYNYRPRLKSTLEREDTSDWLSFHHNDNDEWLRYGAAIYLHDCDRAEVKDCTVTGGFNGLLMTRCDDGRVWNNNFSFNSGVGIGMYRSSRNRVMHNKLDWNVRGYSHGVYHRGQDSAAILVYEQSCENTFAYNSATHSGDGLFLWAGQTTMDTGTGGCNDNVIAFNDFSYAPTNGVEVTFSRNTIVNNTIHGCDHGIWGGYSYETSIVGNAFAHNRIGIAIEHGADNVIARNTFEGDKTGIRLWHSAKPDPNWGYPKFRDTRSRNYELAGNRFVNVAKPYEITDTHNATTRESNDGAVAPPGVAPLEGGQNAMLPGHHPRGREQIVVDEWGPYDFKSPKLWPREKLADGRQLFEVLGPPGRWKLRSIRGGVINPPRESGDVGDQFAVAMGSVPHHFVDLDIRLEFTGAPVVSPFGRTYKGGEVYPFGFSTFFVPVNWTVFWFRYDDATDPRTRYAAFKKMINSWPIREEATTELAYAWHGPIGKWKGAPADKFATLATGSFEVPAGEYQIEVTSDDGVRVWLDKELIIDNWTWHVPTTDVAQLKLGGRHAIRVEHFEIDGFATLQLRILPVRGVGGKR